MVADNGSFGAVIPQRSQGHDFLRFVVGFVAKDQHV
jgi:hypothetical protein